MITIQVNRDGKVTGDLNSVIAYDSDRFSKPIRILHPDFPNVIHKLLVRQGRIQMTDIISNDDKVRLLVGDAGVVRMQYLAVDATTCETIFSSREFQMVISKSKMHPAGEDPRHRLHSTSLLSQLVEEIEARLKAVGILETSKGDGECVDFNLMTEDAECLTALDSKNSPEAPQFATMRYLLRVRRVGHSLTQRAEILDDARSGIFYRTGYLTSGDGEIHAAVWQNWVKLAEQPLQQAAQIVELNEKVIALERKVAELSARTVEILSDEQLDVQSEVNS